MNCENLLFLMNYERFHYLFICLLMDQIVFLHESMFMICFLKNINFGDMMKLFYKFELKRKFFYSNLWPSSMSYNN